MQPPSSARTDAEPLAVTVTMRRWLPAGFARQTLKVAGVPPAIVAGNVMAPKVSCVMRSSGGSACCRCRIVPSASLTIHPTCQPPEVAQVVPFDDAQSVTGALRLIA